MIGADSLGVGAVSLIRDPASPLLGYAAGRGSRYSGPGERTWTKRGTGDTDWAQALLSEPYHNVLDYGAVADGVTDDAPAIQDAIDAAVLAGGGVVFFPAGTYALHFVAAGVARIFDLDDTSWDGLLFMGEGRASRLLAIGDSAGVDFRMFEMRALSSNIGFKNLCFDGSGITNYTEQQHLIQWSSVTPGVTGRSFVIDCYFNFIKGDQIRTVGSDTSRVADIIIKRCVFDGFKNGGGICARSGVSIQRATDRVVIDACYFPDNSAIDFEPTGVGSVTQFRISRNLSTGSVTLSGNGLAYEHRYSAFTGNTLVGTAVSGGNVQRCVLSGNIVDYNEAAAVSTGLMSFVERFQHNVLADNIVARGADFTLGGDCIAMANQGGTGDNKLSLVDGNLCLNLANIVDGGYGVTVRAATKTSATNNMCLTTNSTAGNTGCIRFEGILADMSEMVGSGNMGVGLSAAHNHGVSGGSGGTGFTDNFFRNVQTGVSFSAQDAEPYVAARNVLVSTVAAVSVSGGGTHAVIDAHGPTIFQATVDPEADVVADIGSVALRHTGGAAGTTLYVKEADNGANTGWVAK